MKQYTENQYDDDLTVGTDDYDDSYYTGSVDLFEFSNDEDSPISRLKSLILSIDWEITDEVLMQFNEELVDLKDIWAGKKINLIYVQALEKISKYIYQKKADSHPSAIKLLLTLYHNLEKIVSSSDLTEEQKKEILLEDVKRFESLKRHISQQAESIDNGQLTQSKPEKQTDILGDHDLLNLKAIVLGIDWEITDEDLNQLRQEVVRLEEKFADSKPRLILLQGIGALGTYIKLKKSNAHSDAFKILHLFYESLEKIVATPMNLKEEKAILFPAVEKFNAFKNLLGPTITPEAIDRSKNEIEENDSPSDSVITPAFADFPEDVMGFQADEEVKSLGIEASDNVDNHVESFFMGSSFQNPETALPSEASAFSEDQAIALQGVDVELDDEDDERSPIQNNNPTPALSEKIVEEPYPAFQEDESVGDTEQDIERPVENTEDISIALESMLEENEKTGLDFSKLDKDIVLQGVDVETEADDDSDEEALPMMEGQLAPALAENDEVSMFNAGIFENSSETRIVDEEIEGTLGGFFDEEIDSHLSAAPKVEDNEDLDIFSTMDDPELDDSKTELSNNSFSDFGLEKNETEDEKEIKLEEDDFTPLVAEGIFSTPIDENFEFFGTEKEPESGKDEDDEQVDDNSIAAISELEQDENADTSFDESDFERPAEEIGSNIFTDDSELALSQDEEQENSEIDEQLDSFFDLREDEEENKEENTLFSTSPEIIEEDQEIEEEVVFELAEDGQISPVEPEIDENEDAYPEELETTENEDSVQVLVSEDDDAADGDAHSLPELEKDVPLTVFGKLGICVDSLGVELDDKVVQGLWEEINNLRQSFIDKPLEKTFLQLLFTVVKHIDQNRYDSSTDAYVLLKSICNALYDLQDNDLQHNQEMLFKETEKVLTWQEDILAEQTAKNEAELTIDGTAIIAQEDVNSDFNDLAQKYEQQPVDEEYESDLLSYSTDGNGFTDELDKSSDRKDTKMLHSDLKQEISMLRQTLQDEIAELRKELKGKYLS